MDSVFDEQRSNIKFLVRLEWKTANIYQDLKKVHGDQCLSKTQVYEWAARYRQGRQKVRDDRDKSGRKPYVLSKALVEGIKTFVENDRRVTLKEVQDEFDISATSALHVIHDVMKMSKVCARWVPKKLEPDHKKARLELSKRHLSQVKQLGSSYLERIVTGDETWIPFRSCERKQSSRQWKHLTSPTPRKFKIANSKDKVMYVMFWDCRGLLLTYPVPKGETVNATLYCKVLQALHSAIIKKRGQAFASRMLLLHDNASTHTAVKTLEKLSDLNMEVLAHSSIQPGFGSFGLFSVSRAQEIHRGETLRVPACSRIRHSSVGENQVCILVRRRHARTNPSLGEVRTCKGRLC